MTYAKPLLVPLADAVANALCCQVVISNGDNSTVIGPLICPFPVDTGTTCVHGPDLPTICIYSS